MMKNSLRAFSDAKTAKVEKFVDYVEEYLGRGKEAKEAVKQMMKNNLQAFSHAKTAEVEKTIKYIENLIGKNKVKKKIKRDLKGVVTLKQFKLEQWEQWEQWEQK